VSPRSAGPPVPAVPMIRGTSIAISTLDMLDPVSGPGFAFRLRYKSERMVIRVRKKFHPVGVAVYSPVTRCTW